MADGIVKAAAAVDKLESLAVQELKLQSQVGKNVRALKRELEWLSTFLRDEDCQRRQDLNGYIDLLVRQTREEAFDADDLLEEYIHRGHLQCHHALDLPSLLRCLWRPTKGLFVRHSICNSIDEIKVRLAEIKKKRDEHKLQSIPFTWAHPQKYYIDWYIQVL